MGELGEMRRNRENASIQAVSRCVAVDFRSEKI